MDEYIERRRLYESVAYLEELARERVLNEPTNSPSYVGFVCQLSERTNFKNMIFDAPAADVAPVVRCKDCVFYTDNIKNPVYRKGFCNRIESSCFDKKNPNDFCSYGERKK